MFIHRLQLLNCRGFRLILQEVRFLNDPVILGNDFVDQSGYPVFVILTEILLTIEPCHRPFQFLGYDF